MISDQDNDYQAACTTAPAHNVNYTGRVEPSFSVAYAPAYDALGRARRFVRDFKAANMDIQLSDEQWTKLIDALAAVQ